jgi:hypothetical protein
MSPWVTVDILILLSAVEERGREKIVTILNPAVFFYVRNRGHLDRCLYSVLSYVFLAHMKL